MKILLLSARCGFCCSDLAQIRLQAATLQSLDSFHDRRGIELSPRGRGMSMIDLGEVLGCYFSLSFFFVVLCDDLVEIDKESAGGVRRFRRPLAVVIRRARNLPCSPDVPWDRRQNDG